MGRGRRSQHTRPAVPTRRCLCCRAVRPQTELLRITAVEGAAVLDTGRKLGGRGAWLCRAEKCAKDASKGAKVSRALKGQAKEPQLERLLGWVKEVQGAIVATGPSLDGREHEG